MSEQISFDRGKGFVALPVGILDMDLSPGAFRTLVELCRMANADGFCWPSLTQLSERLGRSKSAISGYLKDLRALDLVTTEEQRTANGYNYRLKYQVTFWAEWRASLSNRHAEKRERRVQPVERPSKDKNQNHINHSGGEKIDQLLGDWANCFGRAPFPNADQVPTEELRKETAKALEATNSLEMSISADILEQLETLFTSIGLRADRSELQGPLRFLQSLELSSAELHHVLTRIAKSWPEHWRKTPTDAQFQRLVKDTGVTPMAKKMALLKSNLSRWRMAERSLRNRPASCSVTALTTPGRLAS